MILFDETFTNATNMNLTSVTTVTIPRPYTLERLLTDANN